MIPTVLLIVLLGGCDDKEAERAGLPPRGTMGGGYELKWSPQALPAEERVPPRPAVPPLVTGAPEAMDRDLQWVELRGRLVVVDYPGGAKARRFTHLQLDDGLKVNLTYGDPPPGWEALVGKRLSVVGVLTLCGDLDGGQSTLGPHLARWEEPRILDEVAPAQARSETGSSEASRRITNRCLGRE